MPVSAGGVRRTAVVPLVAAAGLLLASLVSCTGSPEPGTSGSAAPGSGGSKPPSSAPPGKFQTLPEACGAVPLSALARLLPGTGTASPSPEDSGGAGGRNGEDGSGKATLTYDTDRRVGCEWSGEGDSWNRYLHVDMERVISYDPAVSDEEQAQEEYLDAAGAADIPGGGSGGASDSASPGSGGAAQDGGGSSSDTASPRIIAGIGDEAFLEDRLNAEAAEPHREVVIVFRKANVIVTVELREWPLDGGPLPSGSAMRMNAHHVAQELAKVFNER